MLPRAAQAAPRDAILDTAVSANHLRGATSGLGFSDQHDDFPRMSSGAAIAGRVWQLHFHDCSYLPHLKRLGCTHRGRVGDVHPLAGSLIRRRTKPRSLNDTLVPLSVPTTPVGAGTARARSQNYLSATRSRSWRPTGAAVHHCWAAATAALPRPERSHLRKTRSPALELEQMRILVVDPLRGAFKFPEHLASGSSALLQTDAQQHRPAQAPRSRPRRRE